MLVKEHLKSLEELPSPKREIEKARIVFLIRVAVKHNPYMTFKATLEMPLIFLEALVSSALEKETLKTMH